jgi:hypothetical protein
MSAIGTKQTSSSALHMSAFGCKADIIARCSMRVLRANLAGPILAKPAGGRVKNMGPGLPTGRLIAR